jgi:hypothetical protein
VSEHEVSEHDLTILRAAASILHDDALTHVRQTKTPEDREYVNAALLACVSIEKYLDVREARERPF